MQRVGAIAKLKLAQASDEVLSALEVEQGLDARTVGLAQGSSRAGDPDAGGGGGHRRQP